MENINNDNNIQDEKSLKLVKIEKYKELANDAKNNTLWNAFRLGTSFYANWIVITFEPRSLAEGVGRNLAVMVMSGFFALIASQTVDNIIKMNRYEKRAEDLEIELGIDDQEETEVKEEEKSKKLSLKKRNQKSY